MNILDTQEMVNVEKFLLSVEVHPNYTFTTFDSTLASSLKTFSSTFFLIPNKSTKQQIHKLITNTDNIIIVNKDQTNSNIKLFAYTVFAIIFPTAKLINNQPKTNINDSLLETLKCSIYSKDINFNQISSKQSGFDNLQAKAMIARFFNSLTKHHQLSNMQKIKYIQWTLQNNHIINQLFIRFYRIILNKIGIEGAENYYQTLGFDQTINNLIEYFDIHYRYFKQCFLISEENYFLAQTKEYLVMGEYFQNQTKKIDEKKSHLVEPFSSIKRASSPKRNAVIQNDVKMFNFILDSGIHQKQNDIETPHFTDSNHQFVFGRKKRDEDQFQRQEELKRQFEKLIMNSSSQIQQDQSEKIVKDLSIPPTPFLGGEFAFTKIEKEFQENIEKLNHPSFVRKPTFHHQSPIHQLSDQNFETPKINPESSRCKNIVSVKDKNFTTFSPQITNGPRYDCFTNLTNDALFIDQENIECFKSSSGNIAERAEPFLWGQCKCVQRRKMRNLIVSRVIQFIHFPINKLKNYTSRSPKFINNLKFSQNLGFKNPQIRVIPAKDKNQQNQNNVNKQARKPTFLKFLKKGKQKPQKYSASSHSISKSKSKSKSRSRNNSIRNQSANKQKSVRFELDKETLNRINNKIAKYSAIYNKQTHQNRSKQYSQSTSRKHQSSSANKRMITQQGTSIKKFDSKYMNARPGLGNNWKSSSNFHQPNRQRKHADYAQFFDNKKRQTMKVYAPVNIIAPTVYFNGNYQRDNKVIFKVNDHPKDMQLKQSQRIKSNQEFIHSDKSIGFYSKRYT